jgi:FMN reductase
MSGHQPTIIALSGSPSATSRTAQLIPHVEPALRRAGYRVETIHIRQLPADDLFTAQVSVPLIAEALGRMEQAAGVVIATPIYKAAYTGMLKSFLDVLPQFGLTGKSVLPLATGGSIAHVLAIDYALRPVLTSLNARHIVNGLFILDKQIVTRDGGGIELDADVQRRLDEVLAAFIQSLDAFTAKPAALAS